MSEGPLRRASILLLSVRRGRPIIFKTHVDQAYAGAGTFVPGFGATIGDAVVGSCSAYPFFSRKFVEVDDGVRIQVGDGGYAANNPTLYAVAP